MTPAELECELGERAGVTLGLSAPSGALQGRFADRPAVIRSVKRGPAEPEAVRSAPGSHWGRVGHQQHTWPHAILVI